MSRPEHPGVPLPVSCIWDLRERQRAYDEDPAGYERRERERLEARLEEELEMRRQEDEWRSANE